MRRVGRTQKVEPTAIEDTISSCESPSGSVTVPLLAPSRSLLRADAVWVTVCNWAEALDRRYGASQILAGTDTPTIEELRHVLFDDPDSPYERQRSPIVKRIRSAPFIKPVETLAKDSRWALGGRRSAIPTPEAFAGTPYVWQHHNLFHRRGRALADALGVPLLHFVDAPHVWESERWGISRGPFTSLVERLGEQPQARSADLVACVSDEVANAVVERLGVQSHRIVITPCTVDVERFARTDATALRQELGLENKVVVGWIGSFRPFHAVDVLIESFAAASRSAPALHLMLVGSGAVLADAKADVARRGLGDRVTFVGAVPNELAPDYISLFDIAVLPATDGPFHYSPLKLREFAAVGSAIIAADVGNISATIKDGEEALIVGAGTPAALGEAIVALATDPERRRQLGSAAQRAASARFGMQQVLELVEQRLS